LEDYRLELAKKYGADHCINARKEDAVQRVKEITGRGSDVVVEAAGTTRTVEQTPYMARNAGKVALIGESSGHLNLDEAAGTCFFTTYISPVEYPLALKLIADKKVDVRGLITHRFKLSDIEKALQTADNVAEKPVKVIITE
jgi:L-iditol 2-dehydrogenase